MSKGFIFATTSNFSLVKQAANSAFEQVIENENEINCYSGTNIILISVISENELDVMDDFRDSLNSFTKSPINNPLENFNCFYGQLLGEIYFTNELFSNLENLMIMINYPNIILYKDIITQKDISYDWYSNEQEISISPDS